MPEEGFGMNLDDYIRKAFVGYTDEEIMKIIDATRDLVNRGTIRGYERAKDIVQRSFSSEGGNK
jgi:uncharacterized membrane protein YkoI